MTLLPENIIQGMKPQFEEAQFTVVFWDAKFFCLGNNYMCGGIWSKIRLDREGCAKCRGNLNAIFGLVD